MKGLRQMVGNIQSKIGNKWVVLSHSAKMNLSYEKEKKTDLFWEHLPGDSFERRNSVEGYQTQTFRSSLVMSVESCLVSIQTIFV